MGNRVCTSHDLGRVFVGHGLSEHRLYRDDQTVGSVEAHVRARPMLGRVHEASIRHVAEAAVGEDMAFDPCSSQEAGTAVVNDGRTVVVVVVVHHDGMAEEEDECACDPGRHHHGGRETEEGDCGDREDRRQAVAGNDLQVHALVGAVDETNGEEKYGVAHA